MASWVKILKTFFNDANTQGYNNTSQHKRFHVFSEDVDSIYLTETELQQLKDVDFSENQRLERVRDWFLLLAWTGCRFSDLEKVSKTDIKDGFITFRQQKTNTKVTIPLHPVVIEILEKYNFDLPKPITNAEFNINIKEACKTAKINSPETMTRTVGGKLTTEKFEKWQRVSSHTGRRSFCTNMYKRGLSTLMIMSISGHKTEVAFLKYIKIKQDEHAGMMKKAWDGMYKEPSGETFLGTVDTLDGIDKNNKRRGSVTITILYNNEVFKPKVYLSPEHYQIAVDAHKKGNRYIKIVGDLKIDDQKQVIENVSDFSLV